MVKKNILGILASSVLLFTSCLGESDPEAYCAGYFTIQSNANSTDVVLYMDGGGTFYPTSSTVYDATDGKGFGSVKRAYFILYYPENLITYDADKNIIAKQVSINSGEYLPLADPLTVEEALEKNLLENDSLNEMASMSRIWAYKGYLTNIYASKYVIQSNMGVRPTLNMTLKPSELHPGEMDATFLLNQQIKS